MAPGVEQLLAMLQPISACWFESWQRGVPHSWLHAGLALVVETIR